MWRTAVIASHCVYFVLAGALQQDDKTGRLRRDIPPLEQPKGIQVPFEKWHMSSPYLPQVLASIEDRLRGLDAFGAALRLTRVDLSLEQLLRKVDSLESRMGRLEAKLDIRLDKMEARKEESTNDEELGRRIDTLADKVTTKLDFLETKLDMRSDRLTNKLELLDRDLQDSLEDVLEKVTKSEEQRVRMHSDISRALEVIDRTEVTQRQLEATLRFDVRDTLKWADAKLDLFNHQLLTQRDILKEVQEKMGVNGTVTSGACSREDVPTAEQVTNLTELVEKVLRVGAEQFREIDSDVESYTRKVINGMYELRRTTDELDSVAQGNRTRLLVRDEFKKLHAQIEPLPLLEPRLTLLSEGLEKRIVHLGATVDQSFATLLVAQNSFISSCHRIQEEEVQLYDLLELIIHEMRNRSLSDTQRLSDQLQGHADDFHGFFKKVVSAIFAVGNSTLGEVKRLFTGNHILCTKNQTAVNVTSDYRDTVADEIL
ncbi:uncharacterized protein LOC135371567 isoform X2 [Ornithodoros turicata]|uniref:uncharacterized protein LOC135371567 isoform X2 n=1 Tax=Ornithodoros turicata TaxID=34597 RepID=UPI003139AA37